MSPNWVACYLNYPSFENATSPQWGTTSYRRNTLRHIIGNTYGFGIGPLSSSSEKYIARAHWKRYYLRRRYNRENDSGNYYLSCP